MKDDYLTTEQAAVLDRIRTSGLPKLAKYVEEQFRQGTPQHRIGGYLRAVAHIVDGH